MVRSEAVVTQVESHRVGVRRDTRDGAQLDVGCNSLFFFFSPEGGEERSAVDLS